MHARLRVVLVGLCCTVALVATSGPARADWQPAITDVMSLVYCLVGQESCVGLQPGAETVTQLNCGAGTELSASGAQCILPGATGGGDETGPPPANASWSVTISDVMNLIYCLVGLGGCDGLKPGLDTVVLVTCGAGTVLDATSSHCIPGVDACGVQGGDGSSCADCEDIPNGPATLDECDVCDDDPSNDCVQDCAGTWGGDATTDNCGACDADPTNDCTQDCAGTWGGAATYDGCGYCDADTSNDCAQDCAGTWGGAATYDGCGYCDADTSNDCTQDCAGTWGGAAVDMCGVCVVDAASVPEPDPCGSHASCQIQGADYDCTCGAGYEGDGWTGCVDIDECMAVVPACGANADCSNTEGSFACACKAFYDGDPFAGCVSLDNTPPVITAFVLADGAESLALPSATTYLEASDDMASGNALLMQFTEGAQTPDPEGWRPYSLAGSTLLSTISGTKVVTPWVMDGVGHITEGPSDTVILEYAQPPVVQVTAPGQGVMAQGGDVISVAWTCAPSGAYALDTPPIARIEMTTDSGASFETVATDLPNNEGDHAGSYDWTLPEALSGVPFRLLVSCRSQVGVIANAYSQPVNVGDWQIYMGNGFFGDENVSAHIVDMRPASEDPSLRPTVTTDRWGNVFFSRRLPHGTSNTIMRIDHETALVTNATPDLTCSVNIIGSTQDREYLLLWAQGCDNKVLRYHTATGAIEDWAQLETHIHRRFLTRDRVLFYLTRPFEPEDNALFIYKVDLSAPGSPSILIHGNGQCGGAVITEADLTAQTPALLLPIPAVPYSNECTANTAFVANADGSKLWVSTSSYGASADDILTYRLDATAEDPDNYVLGGVLSDSFFGRQKCTASDFDQKVYCPPYDRGNTIQAFDTETETWEPPFTLEMPGDDTSGRMGLGSFGERLVLIHSLNAIYALEPHAAAAWDVTQIAGQVLTMMGNGGGLSGVVFHSPTDIEVHPATGMLWVGNVGHLRRLNLNGSTPAVSTVFNSDIINYHTLSLTPDGGELLIRYGWCSPILWPFILDLVGEDTYLDDNEEILGGNSCTTIGVHPTPPFPVSGRADQTIVQGWPSNQAPIFDADRSTYFGGHQESSDVYLLRAYRTDVDGVGTQLIDKVAGLEGPGGYDPSDEGALAYNASLTEVGALQRDAQGDLLVWDHTRLRRVTTATEPEAPTITTLFDYDSQVLDYSGDGEWYDAIYDETTDITYYVTSSGSVHRITPLAEPVGGKSHVDIIHGFAGTSMSDTVRIARLDNTLLVLQKNQRRILAIDDEDLSCATPQWTGDGYACGSHTVCTNTSAGLECSCLEGFEGDPSTGCIAPTCLEATPACP